MEKAIISYLGSSISFSRDQGNNDDVDQEGSQEEFCSHSSHLVWWKKQIWCLEQTSWCNHNFMPYLKTMPELQVDASGGKQMEKRMKREMRDNREKDDLWDNFSSTSFFSSPILCRPSYTATYLDTELNSDSGSWIDRRGERMKDKESWDLLPFLFKDTHTQMSLWSGDQREDRISRCFFFRCIILHLNARGCSLSPRQETRENVIKLRPPLVSQSPQPTH